MAEKRVNTVFRQRQIAVAAAELILKYGSEHLTIKQIASHTNLSEAAIYRHFKSKKDILRFLLRHIELTLLADLNPSNFQDTITPVDLDMMIGRHISHIENSHGVGFQVIAEVVSMGNITLNQNAYEIINSYISSLAQIFQQRNARNADNIAFIFFASVQGLVILWALSGYTFDFKQKYNHLWSTINKMLLKV